MRKREWLGGCSLFDFMHILSRLVQYCDRDSFSCPKAGKDCPYSRNFCPYPRRSFSYCASTKASFPVHFPSWRRWSNVSRKKSPLFSSHELPFLNVSARPNFLSKHWVVWAKKRNFAAYKDRPAPFRVRFAGQPERRCKNVYKRKSLTARPKT